MEQDQEIPRLTSKTKGKKRKACDRCVRLKKACSQGYPCEGCREKKDACTLDGVAQGLRGHEDEEETPSQPNSGVSVATEHAKLDAWHDEDQINHNGLVFDQPDPGTDIEFLMEDERSWDFLNHWSLDLEESRRNPSARSVEHLLGVNNGQETEEIRQFAPEFDLAELGKFPFLARFTTETGFVKSFECGTLAERQAIVREIRNHEYNLKSQVANSGGHTQSLLSNPDIGPISPPRLGFDSRWDNQYFNSTTLQPGPHQFQPAKESHNILQSMDIPMSPSIAFQSNVEVLHDSQESETLWSAWLSDSLAHKTYEIVDRIKDITLYRLRGSKIAINWSPPVERMCLDFFSPPNIRKHLALFWSCWYPNCPIIHRPSFEATRASPLLIASMVLLGACISPDNRDHAGANIWLNSVEEMIFSCEEFCDEINASMGNSTLEILAMQRRLEALHAAYFISLVQNWEGSEESRRRIRRHRYNAIIAFTRDFGISNATLNDVHADDICIFKWERFILRESLVRTFIYVFLFDSSFVIFNNSPPRMVVPELRMDLACPESCFQAASSEECFVHLNTWNVTHESHRRPNLSAAIETMTQEQISVEHQLLFSSLSTLNMFAIVTGLHCFAFQIKSSFVSQSDISPIFVGISNWKQFWLTNPREDLAVPNMDNLGSMWARVGFIRHAPEFWLLVKVLLDKMNLPQSNLAQEESFAIPREAGSNTGLLAKFDDSDMSQVNALITSLQHVRITT